MKLQKLFEVEERLNREIYGEWITPAGKVLEVPDSMSHAQWFAKEILGSSQSSMIGKAEELAYKEGWVRVAHPIGQNMLFLDGIGNALRKSIPLLAGTVANPSTKILVIRKRDTDDQTKFELPGERQEAMAFLRGE